MSRKALPLNRVGKLIEPKKRTPPAARSLMLPEMASIALPRLVTSSSLNRSVLSLKASETEFLMPNSPRGQPVEEHKCVPLF